MTNIVPAPAPSPATAPAESAAWGRSLPAAGWGSEEQGGFDWRRLLAAVFRYKWLVVGLALVGLAAGAVASRFVPPVYVAQATVWVPVQPGPGQARTGRPSPDQLFSAVGWIELIKTSFVVLDNVVRDLRLFIELESPADSVALAGLRLKDRFAPGNYELRVSPDGSAYELRTREGRIIEEGAVGDSVGRRVGFAWLPAASDLPPGSRIDFGVVPPRDAALRLQEHVDARINERGASIMALRLTGTDPNLIAATVNRVAEGFVDTAKSLSNAKQRELVRALESQLDSAGTRLRAAEIALEDFRVRTITLPSERATPIAPGIEQTTNPALTSFLAMKVELDALARDRESIESALAAAGDTGLTANALLYVGAVQQSGDLSAALSDLTQRQAAITALRMGYTDEHPEVQRAASEIRELRRRTIPDLARGLLGQLAAREQELSSRIGSAGVQLREIPRRSTDEQRLRREVEIAAGTYQELKRQYQGAVYSESAEGLGARVLDPAIVPRRPIRDTALRLLGMAFLASLGIGVALAILLDRIDRRVRYPEQVSRDLGLPILGAIPRVKQSNGRTLRAADTAQVVEALRGVRLGLVHAHGAAGPVIVTITSPGTAEGKSFVASNLALAFADAGHRTVLIDGDVRRGELHRLVGTARKPGLTDYLEGKVPQQDVLQTTRYDRLHFIGAGTRSHGAPELLGSAGMQQLVLWLRSSFDIILLDSPPLGAGVDPFVLGTATGNLLLVLRTGVTNRELAEAKLDMLDRLPIRVLGAVLNDVRHSQAYRYYYGYEYYVEGYETRDEKAAPLGELAGGSRSGAS